MDKNTWWKWTILLVAVFASLLLVLPLSERVRLGLDLKGGTSFVVEIDWAALEEQRRESTDKELGSDAPGARSPERRRDAQASALEVIRNRVDGLGITEPIIYPAGDDRIVVQLPGIDEAKRLEAEKSIQSAAFLEFRLVHENDEALTAKLFEKNLAPEGYRIEYENGKSYYARDKAAVPDEAMDQEFRDRLRRFEAPSGFEFMLEKTRREGNLLSPHFVRRRRELTGEYLKRADVDYTAVTEPYVTLQFDSEGARRFGRITTDYGPRGPRNPDRDIGRQLAIVMDDTLYSSPVIREAIVGGRAQIEGAFTITEAMFLANVLNAGALPAPVKIIEKRIISPSLGKDSIDSGVRATVYGSILVALFMAGYYLLSGLIADVALMLNLILLPLGMVVVGGFLGIFAKDAPTTGKLLLPVLTLPGIAGIGLSLGMAVDANVLIYERIREELAAGKRFWAAITAGYERAFLAILDSNITTMFTGVILFVFGSGPLRGFAVTLCAGIAVSMFTAIVVTRLIFSLLAEKAKLAGLKMFQLIRATNIDFIGKWKIAAALSVAIIAATWGVMIMRGMDNPANVLGVDFTGGTSLTCRFREKQDVEQLRSALAGAGIRDARIQYQTDTGTSGGEYLQIHAGISTIKDAKTGETARKALAEQFPAAGFEVVSEDDVGPQVGKELTRKAIWAMALALLGMVIYLSWRFEFIFSIGAIVALLHDVVITAGIYSALGRQINLTVVAVLLTIIGYSVNDTIVLFDRIRENMRLEKSKVFRDICNLSVNQTLGRTLLTSLTVFMMVIMLLVFGGGAIGDLAISLFIGLLAGTYSTVYIATPVVLMWRRDKKA